MKPYSPHYRLAPQDKVINKWLAVFANSHDGTPTFLDIGGRGGEALQHLPSVKSFEHIILERDAPKVHSRRSLVCDVFNCSVGKCSSDVVFSRYALEHFVSASKGVQAMASFVKRGGLLITIVPFAARYHADDAYGDYTRLSPRALDYLCIENGLSPVVSGFDSGAAKDPNKDGVRPRDVLDRHPYVWPGTAAHNSFAVCYRPRYGERHVPFEEVGQQPVELHPRFALDFRNPRSESKEPLLMRVNATLTPVMSHDASLCSNLPPGSLVVASPTIRTTLQAVVSLSLLPQHDGQRHTGQKVRVSHGADVYIAQRIGRC